MTSAADREERSFLHNFLSQGEREYKDTAYEQARPPARLSPALTRSLKVRTIAKEKNESEGETGADKP